MTDTSTIRRLERIALQLRFDLIEMIGQGKFGHLGGSSSLAEITACLYFHAMRYDPKNPRTRTVTAFCSARATACSSSMPPWPRWG